MSVPTIEELIAHNTHGNEYPYLMDFSGRTLKILQHRLIGKPAGSCIEINHNYSKHTGNYTIYYFVDYDNQIKLSAFHHDSEDEGISL
jgi:hypothetical protein